MITIKNFDPNLLKIEKKPYQNIDIFYIGYMTMKNTGYYVFIVSILCILLLVKYMDALKKNGTKYLIFTFTNKNKKVLDRYNTGPLDGVKSYNK